jgi:hypothetical protein
MDTESIIKEWLSEYEKVDKDNLFTYAKALTEKEDTSLAIFKVLEDRNKYAEVDGNFLIVFMSEFCANLFCFQNRASSPLLSNFTISTKRKIGIFKATRCSFCHL